MNMANARISAVFPLRSKTAANAGVISRINGVRSCPGPQKDNGKSWHLSSNFFVYEARLRLMTQQRESDQ